MNKKRRKLLWLLLPGTAAVAAGTYLYFKDRAEEGMKEPEIVKPVIESLDLRVRNTLPLKWFGSIGYYNPADEDTVWSPEHNKKFFASLAKYDLLVMPHYMNSYAPEIKAYNPGTKTLVYRLLGASFDHGDGSPNSPYDRALDGPMEQFINNPKHKDWFITRGGEYVKEWFSDSNTYFLRLDNPDVQDWIIERIMGTMDEFPQWNGVLLDVNSAYLVEGSAFNGPVDQYTSNEESAKAYISGVAAITKALNKRGLAAVINIDGIELYAGENNLLDPFGIYKASNGFQLESFLYRFGGDLRSPEELRSQQELMLKGALQKNNPFGGSNIVIGGITPWLIGAPTPSGGYKELHDAFKQMTVSDKGLAARFGPYLKAYNELTRVYQTALIYGSGQPNIYMQAPGEQGNFADVVVWGENIQRFQDYITG